MPIYEYRCAECGEEFEKLVFADTENVSCVYCNATQVSRIMSVCAISVGNHFKATTGSGCSSCTPSPTGCSTCGGKR